MADHFCSGRMSGGRRCYFRGIIRIKGAWYCRRHATAVTKVPKKNEILSNEELQAIRKMVNHYRVRGSLGKGVDYEEMWAGMVPRLLEEVLLRRKID
jgi:hypothetical protein